MDRTDCIFCGIPSERVVISERRFHCVKCPRCGLIYLSSRPTWEAVVGLYRDDEAHIPAEAHIAAEFSSRLYARHHLKIILNHVPGPGGAILEIGAGAGFFLDEARRVGFEPHAIEFNPTQAGFVTNRLHIPCEQTPLHPGAFGDKRFDIIYHCDVISHFYDPIAEFTQARDKLKPGGFLVFETGNLADVREEYYKYYTKFQLPDHLFFFGGASLLRLLKISGFELVKVYSYSILPQLRAMRAVARLRRRLARTSRDAPGSVVPVTHPSTRVARRQRPVRVAWAYFNYVLRYQLGRVLPKAHRPQTLIVVGRRT